MEPRAYTEEEVRTQLFEHIKQIVHYWSSLPNKTDIEKCDGVAFSMLNIFDGTSSELPAFDILLSPHDDDKEYHIKNGENYYEKGMMINNCMLHELYLQKQ